MRMLRVTITKTEGEIVLIENDQVGRSHTFAVDRHTGRRLLEVMQRLLKSAHKNFQNIGSIELDIAEDVGSSVARTAKVTVETLQLSKELLAE